MSTRSWKICAEREDRSDLDDVIDCEDPIMESLKEVAFEYKEKVLVCLRLLLPELAKG